MDAGTFIRAARYALFVMRYQEKEVKKRYQNEAENENF